MRFRTTLVSLTVLAACGQKTEPAAVSAAEPDAVDAAAPANDVPDAETATTAPDVAPTDSAAAVPDVADVVQPQVWTTDLANMPTAVHLTWQHDPATTVTVQWATTATELTGYQPKVWFAPEAVAGADGAKIPFATTATASGAGEVYYQSLVTPTADDPHWVTWTVELTGLKPDTAYVYRAGTWEALDGQGFAKADLSDVLHFHTAPAKGKRQPFSAILAGDSRGAAKLIEANADRLSQIDAAVWIFNGDFCTSGLQPDWDEWFAAMAPILNKRVLLPVLGNHEFFPPMFFGQFALPILPGVPQDYKEHAWSLDLANVHFVGLDSMQDSAVLDQVPWLEADLQAARADPAVDWIIVMMHHPGYSASKHGSTERVTKYWSPLFDKYDVDLVFAGHDHNYERTVPIRAGKKVTQGPIYIVAGSFFVDEPYKAGKAWWTQTSANGEIYNYVQLNVDGKTLSWQAFSGDGKQVLDTHSLQK